MIKARLENDWNHTANLLAMTAEINRDSKRRREPFTPIDFHPFAKRPNPPKPEKANIMVLKQVFVDKDFVMPER